MSPGKVLSFPFSLTSPSSPPAVSSRPAFRHRRWALSFQECQIEEITRCVYSVSESRLCVVCVGVSSSYCWVVFRGGAGPQLVYPASCCLSLGLLWAPRASILHFHAQCVCGPVAPPSSPVLAGVSLFYVVIHANGCAAELHSVLICVFPYWLVMGTLYLLAIHNYSFMPYLFTSFLIWWLWWQ